MNRKKLMIMLLGLIFVMCATRVTYALYEGKPQEINGPKEEITQLQGQPEGFLVDAKSKTKSPEYAPGQLIIKFKPEVGAQAGKLFKEGRKFQSLTGTDALYQVSELSSDTVDKYTIQNNISSHLQRVREDGG